MEDGARLLYSVTVRRERYARLFLRTLLGTLAAVAAYAAIDEAQRRGMIDLTIAPLWLLDTGRVVAVIVALWLAARSIYHLFLLLSRRRMTIRVYNRGVLWGTKAQQQKAGWGQLERIREGASGLYVFNRPVLQWGAHQLTFAAGDTGDRTLSFRPYHGDPRHFAHVVRPYAARVTGVRIGADLRAGRPVQLHKRLTVYPGGVEAGTREIHWDDLHLSRANGRLIVRWRDAATGKWHTAGRYRVGRVANVDGLIEVWKGIQQTRQAAAKQKSRTQRHAPLSDA